MIRQHVGLIDACDDKQLFGFPLWPEQRKLLAQVERGPRMHVWALGRRSSKSTMMGLVGLWCCLLRPELLARLRPGERGYAVAVGTKREQAQLPVRAALSVIERSPLLRNLVESATEDMILFKNGTAFAAFPCSSRGGRGWPIFCVLLDEFAHHFDEVDGPQAADKVYQAFVPSALQFGDDGRVIVGSTPWGSTGLFADLFVRTLGGEIPNAVAHRAPSALMNPTLSEDALAGERVVLGEEAFASEYLAEFVGGGGAFLSPEMIADAIADRRELPPEAGTDWIVGLDPAFSSDPFGLAIVGRDVWDRQQLKLALVKRWLPLKRSRRKPGRSFEQDRALEDAILDEVAEICLRYKARVVTDQYRSPGVVDYLKRKGVAVRAHPMTAATKTEIFTKLRARLALGGLELYEEPDLLSELRRLTTKFAAGQASVRNPRSGDSHGDMAQALALAVSEHDRAGMAGPSIWPQLEEKQPGHDVTEVTAGLMSRMF